MMERLINVLHVMSRLPVGGVERQLSAVLRNYDRKKIMPLVCSLTDKGEIGQEIESMGIEVISLNKLGHGFNMAIIRDLMKIMRDKKIDVVRTHQYHANLYGRIAARLCHVPCILPSVHNLYTRDRKIHRRIINRVLGSISDRVIAVSGAVKNDIISYDGVPAGKVEVLYNGVDDARFRESDGASIRAEFSIPQTSVIVGTVGRLTHQKGQQYLIDAVAILVRSMPDLVAVIVGDGPARAALEDRAASQGLKKKIIFTGTRDDIPDLLAAMDVFVFPSLWEGMPNALVEAMAAGRPIIASDIAPNREVLGSRDTGMIVPIQDSAAIAAAAARIAGDGTFAASLGNEARARALSQFSISGTVAAYTALFENILRQKRSSQLR